MSLCLDCGEGLLAYLKVSDWDIQLRKSGPVQRSYQNNPKTSRVIGLFSAIPIAAAKTITDPILSLICIVVFPIIALIKDDPSYWCGAAFATLHSLTIAALVCICFFLLSPQEAVIMAVIAVATKALVQGKNFYQLHLYNDNDQDYWLEEYF
jgi:hypothetical protein